MIDTMGLQKVFVSMLFVVLLLLLHFGARLWITASAYSGWLCNSGGPFGIMLPQWLLITLSSGIIILIVAVWLRGSDTSLDWPWLLIVSGGLGNLLERIWFGCIIDYGQLLFSPLFNAADIFLTVGTGLALFLYLQERPNKQV